MDATFNVMFVDDELSVLEGIRRALVRKMGSRWGLSFFQNGLGALREIERRQPDVLVTDMKMPGMNGQLLLEIVHARFPGIRTFILSGQCDEQEALGLVGSRDRYLSKPFDSTALQQVLEPADATHIEFLAHMSHELKTPLNAIIGFSDALGKELFGTLGSDRNRTYVQDIHDSGRYLLAIINDILAMSKVEAGKYEICPEEVDLNRLIGGCVRMLQSQADVKGVSLANIMASTPSSATIDSMLIKKSLINVLTNAVKFTPEGGTVFVSLEVLGEQAVISVVDSGVGIAPDDLCHVTEPFIQVGRRKMKVQEGTGLGLALTKRFLELHDGWLEIDSEVGKGTVVRLCFPIQTPKLEQGNKK